MKKKIDNEMREKVVALREQGLTLTEIAGVVGHSPSWVRSVCVDAELTGHYGKRKRNEQMREYKAQGHTSKEALWHIIQNRKDYMCRYCTTNSNPR